MRPVHGLLVAASLVPLLPACQGQPDRPGEEGGAPDAGEGPDAAPAEPAFEIDLFGVVGHGFRFTVSPEQAAEMEETGFDPGREDQYELGGGTYADDLTVTDAEDGDTRALGKVELKLIGESTNRPWNRIPNLRVDLDEFQRGLRLDGVEHFRLNNGQVSGIFREAIALRVWGALGYPVPRTSFAWAEAPTQWGDDTRVPYTLVEVYKPGWCDHAMGGGCVNLWESYGDLRDLPGQCQLDSCDDRRLQQLIDLVEGTTPGPGFAAATEAWIDWDAYRSFQCLSWITGTGDDYVHNNNNLVVAERPDGRFQLLPYSVDISAGQSWYPDVALLGQSALARGCQTDPTCWTGMLARCDELLRAFEQLDVVATIVEPAIAAVADSGMERTGDDVRAAELRAWYGARAAELRADPVWQAAPCTSDADCAEREDGKTSCQDVCTEPPRSCVDEPCPFGFWCDFEGLCRPE